MKLYDTVSKDESTKSVLYTYEATDTDGKFVFVDVRVYFKYGKHTDSVHVQNPESKEYAEQDISIQGFKPDTHKIESIYYEDSSEVPGEKLDRNLLDRKVQAEVDAIEVLDAQYFERPELYGNGGRLGKKHEKKEGCGCQHEKEELIVKAKELGKQRSNVYTPMIESHTEQILFEIAQQANDSDASRRGAEKMMGKEFVEISLKIFPDAKVGDKMADGGELSEKDKEDLKNIQQRIEGRQQREAKFAEKYPSYLNTGLFTDSGMMYDETGLSVHGAYFTLFPFPGYTKEDVLKAKSELRHKFDVVAVKVAKEEDWDDLYKSAYFRDPRTKPLKWYQIEQDEHLIRRSRKSGTTPAQFVDKYVLPRVKETERKLFKRSGEQIYQMANGGAVPLMGRTEHYVQWRHYGNGGEMADGGEVNYGKHKGFEENIFVHSAPKKLHNTIAKKGLQLSRNVVIIRGIFAFPKSWAHHRLFSAMDYDQYEIKLKPGSKIFWTDADRPIDATLGEGNKFYQKIWDEVASKTSLKTRDQVISALQSASGKRNKWFDWKEEFSRGMEKWLSENGYDGIQQGGEVVITNPEAIESLTLDGKDIAVKFAGGGAVCGFYSDCVGYPEVSDLEDIIDNEEEITRETFNKHVSQAEREELERRLGYGEHFPISKDWAVKWFKSKDSEGKTVYFMRHSAIEYVFKPGVSGGIGKFELSFKDGGPPKFASGGEAGTKGRVIFKSDLFFKEGSSDKEYHIQLREDPRKPEGYIVTTQWGRRGSALREEVKTPSALAFGEAEIIYNKVKKEKLGKGYEEVGSDSPGIFPEKKKPTKPKEEAPVSSAESGFDKIELATLGSDYDKRYKIYQEAKGGSAPAVEAPAIFPGKTTKTASSPSPAASGISESAAARGVVFVPQLLNEVQSPDMFINDDRYLAQEKMDGERRPVIATKEGVMGVNKKGQAVPILAEIADSIKGNIATLDGEQVGDKLYIFDITSIDGGSISGLPVTERIKILDKLKFGPNAKVVPTAYTKEEKQALFDKIKAENGEGIVFKKKDAPYRGGRPNSGGDQFKFKFHKTATFIVSGLTAGKRSVGLDLINEKGERVFLGKVTIPPNKEVPKVGDLVEVKYLYAYPGGMIFQPVFLGVRNDQDLSDATTKQLVYKAEVKADGGEAGGDLPGITYADVEKLYSYRQRSQKFLSEGNKQEYQNIAAEEDEFLEELEKKDEAVLEQIVEKIHVEKKTAAQVWKEISGEDVTEVTEPEAPIALFDVVVLKDGQEGTIVHLHDSENYELEIPGSVITITKDQISHHKKKLAEPELRLREALMRDPGLDEVSQANIIRNASRERESFRLGGLFHGSHKKFDKFTLKNVGESGKSVGGWGIYLSTSEDVAKQYHLKSGGMYKVEVKEEGEWMDFDEQIPSDVGERIAKKLKKEEDIEQFRKDFLAQGDDGYEPATGKQVYEYLSALLGSDKKASEFLLGIGIIGNRFKDKTNPEETNYVVFDADAVKIEEKYSEGGEIPVMDEETYLTIHGASRQDIGDSALHKNKGRHSDKTWSKIVDAQAKKDTDLVNRRQQLREEYQDKIAKGELRAPTRLERLLGTAQGMEENESVQAARRILQKQGVDWRTGEKFLQGGVAGGGLNLPEIYSRARILMAKENEEYHIPYNTYSGDLHSFEKIFNAINSISKKDRLKNGQVYYVVPDNMDGDIAAFILINECYGQRLFHILGTEVVGNDKASFVENENFWILSKEKYDHLKELTPFSHDDSLLVATLFKFNAPLGEKFMPEKEQAVYNDLKSINNLDFPLFMLMGEKYINKGFISFNFEWNDVSVGEITDEVAESIGLSKKGTMMQYERVRDSKMVVVNIEESGSTVGKMKDGKTIVHKPIKGGISGDIDLVAEFLIALRKKSYW